MIPFGTHIVTLYHAENPGYSIHTLVNCSWRSTNERSLQDGATVITERTSCRILPQYTKPVPGDLLILGVVDEPVENEIALVRLMEKLRSEGYRAFRVQSCADNSAGVPIPHYAAVGE
jgi:hypothetical protein